MEMNFLNLPQATTSSTTMQIPFSRSGARKELVDKSSSTLPFPFKLHQLLEEAEDCCIDHIVSWLPSEEAFKIHDPDAFVSSVMTKYFKQSKIKSFTRQLYIYGFSKISQGPNMGGFFHPQFRRANQNACMILPRRSSNEDRRVKSNRPKIIECLKTSLAKAKAGMPERSSMTKHEGTFKRVSPIPKMLFGDLPTSSVDPTDMFTVAPNDKKGHVFSSRKALSLFDQTFGDDFDFDLPMNQEGGLPSLGHISFLQSRALPAPPGGLRLDLPYQHFRPAPSDQQKVSNSSREIFASEVISSSQPLLCLEPRAIEDMWHSIPSNDDLAPLSSLALLGTENPAESHFPLMDICLGRTFKGR